MMPPLSGGARRWIPAGRLGKLLELGCPHEGLGQILRVLEHSRDGEITNALVFDGREILGQDRIPTIRNAILLQIAGCHLGRNDFQRRTWPALRGGLRGLSSTSSSTCSAGELPLGYRITLQAGLCRRLGSLEMEKPGLH